MNKIKEFNNMAKLPFNTKPTLGDFTECRLRFDLMEEELMEYWEARNYALHNDEEKGLVQIADALTDMQYILNGMYAYHGLSHLKDRMYAEVHRSNMSKSCDTSFEAEERAIDYRNSNIDCSVEEVDGKFVIYRKDGKVLKGNKFFEPDLKSIVIK